MSADQPDINPYASPSLVATPHEETVTKDEALRRLRKPAICLAGSAAGSLAWGTGMLLFGFGPPQDDLRIQPWLWIPVIGLLVLLPLIVLISAIAVVRGRAGPWLWLAIVSGLIPLGTGCVCFNLVFALWMLHLALQRPIRDALRAKPAVS
jgi:hypothetical protein